MNDFSAPHATALPISPGATIAVAMSGGVDSSVAAALCVAGGYRVFGIMLRLWSEPGATAANKCCTLAAMDDARAVAGVLDIPFQVLDVEAIFKRVVVDAFALAAERGDTPNPCFACNRRMRFGYLLDQARALGADVLATGHYARVARGPDGGYRLLRGLDPSKDQAYVLHRLGQDQLAHALFPIGGHPKTEVRALAERFGLPVASRPDSVDLCWTGPDGVPGFLSRNLPAGAAEPGPIVDLDGRVLGRHRGLPYYTDGQRHGLGIAAGQPVYVVHRDAAANTLIVGPAAALLARRVRVDDMHWVSGSAPDGPIRVEAQIRYRAPGVAATLLADAEGGATLEFDAPVRAPTVGQGLVAYAGETVLGGGRIAGSG